MSYSNYQTPMYKTLEVFTITPIHIATDNVITNSPTISFLAYINDFSENYDSNWTEEEVYGRMDGIHNFSSVKRTFSIGLRIAAENAREARQNMIKISRMIKYLYPAVGKNSYTNGDTKFENFYVRSAPIFKIKFGNIMNSRDGYGLYGIIKGSFSIKPLHEHGWFCNPLEGKENFPILDSEKKTALGQSYDVAFMYKYVDINFTFTVIHDHMLGTNSDLHNNNKGDLEENAYFKEYFPYLVYDKSNKEEPEYGMSKNPEPEYSRKDYIKDNFGADNSSAQILDNVFEIAGAISATKKNVGKLIYENVRNGIFKRSF